MATVTHINITVEKEILKKTDIRAKEFNITRSAFITKVLSEYFQTEEYIAKSLPEIKQGINDIMEQLAKFEKSEAKSSVTGSEAGALNSHG